MANDDLVAEVTDDVKTPSIDDQQIASTNEDIDSIRFGETGLKLITIVHIDPVIEHTFLC